MEEASWGRKHGGGIREDVSWRTCEGGILGKESWIIEALQRRNHVEGTIESSRGIKQEEYRRRRFMEEETNRWSPGEGTLKRELGKSSPGAGIEKRTWSKSNPVLAS